MIEAVPMTMRSPPGRVPVYLVPIYLEVRAPWSRVQVVGRQVQPLGEGHLPGQPVASNASQGGMTR